MNFVSLRWLIVATSPAVAASRRRAAIALSAALFAAASPSFAQSPAVNASVTPDPSGKQNSAPVQDPVIARVGNTEIRESDLRVADEGIGSQLPPLEGEQRREYLIAFLADLARLSKEAQARNLGDESEIKRRMEFTRSKALMDQLMETTGRNAITEEAVHKAYDAFVEKNPPQRELHLRHIVFKFPSLNDQAAVDAAEVKAKDVLKRINAGEDFAKLAAQLSDDPGAKIDSGDLGFQTQSTMGKELAEVAFKLGNNELSAPIKTGSGWDVIRVEGERTSGTSSFEEMRATLMSYLYRQAQVQLVNELRRATPIQRLDAAAAVQKPADSGSKQQ
jgi:peptidyl-prolyl cis-trans isomerase C